jgi:hypothetical protein
MAESKLTRSKDNIWLIGYPIETITGARLPSGRDVMKNFVFHHRLQKRTIADSSERVYDQLLPFWIKSRLPTREKHHVIQKIKQLYIQQTDLLKNRSRSNAKDLDNQRQYSNKLDELLDISHADSYELIKNDEDREFLRLQQESRTGCIGSADEKLARREKRSVERQKRFLKHARLNSVDDDDEVVILEDSSSSSADEQDEFVATATAAQTDLSDKPSTIQDRSRSKVISATVSAALDRTNISIRKSTMILASAINEAGSLTAASVLSKSTVHRLRKRHRQEAANTIKEKYKPTKSVVHWDGKLLPDTTGVDTDQVDRLAILLSSLVDGDTKLLGVPKISAGTGKATAESVFDLLNTWQCNDMIVGMCFDTTASNTGPENGACILLENLIGRNLLWMACRHHMLEVLLADCFGVCFGPSSGPDITLFKRFRENWFKLNHHVPQAQASPLITADDDLKSFISEHMTVNHSRDDYLELLNLAGLMVGLDIRAPIRKPGAMHRARWMAKAIYSMKMELLFCGNESAFTLTARELQGLQRFNRFVVCIYIRSWFTCRMVVDAPFNDMSLIQRLREYDDEALKFAGLNMMKRHSWYLTPELATLVLFSDKVTCDVKTHLVASMTRDRGLHKLKKEMALPNSIAEVTVSQSFFQTTGIDDSFLGSPVEMWSESPSYNMASVLVKNLACVNDCAERGVALIQNFNSSITSDEEQKQYLLQVVEQHRKAFKNCNRDSLKNI